MGTLLNLADCYEKNGQTASAWATFRAATAAASAEGSPIASASPESASFAATHPRAPDDLAAAAGLPAGAEVHRDGILLGRSLWGSPVPVDPGDHAVLVAAPGKIDYSTTVHVPRLSSAAIVARIPALRDRPAPPPTALAPAPVERPPRSPQSTAGLVLLGLGGAGVAVGAIFGVRALGLKDDPPLFAAPTTTARERDWRCGTAPAPRGRPRRLPSSPAAQLAAGGLALYFTAPERQGIKASAGLAGGTAGVTLEATW